jgi:hypothetical protein
MNYKENVLQILEQKYRQYIIQDTDIDMESHRKRLVALRMWKKSLKKIKKQMYDSLNGEGTARLEDELKIADMTIKIARKDRR